MLISRRDGRLVLVTQTEHARLAGEIAAAWGNDLFSASTPPDSVRTAAAMHDDGWAEADDEPLINHEEARPLHFLEIAMEDHIPLYGRGVDRTFAADPYAGLLVSMHWTGLYRSRWGLQQGRLQWSQDARVEQLQDEAVEAQERRWIDVKRELLAETRRSDFEAELWHNYDKLQSWDLLSLYVCLIDLTPAPGVEPVPVPSTLKSIDQAPGPRTIGAVPLAVGGERVEITLRAVEPGVVTLDPYPFAEPEIDFEVGATAIPDRRYADSADARAAIDGGEAVAIRCRMKRP